MHQQLSCYCNCANIICLSLILLMTSADLSQLCLASYPGSNYAGEEKRAWYLPFAVALDFTGISVNSILSVFFR